MARGNFGGLGGMNMNNLMKQAQKMQKQMEEAQSELENKELTVTSGGGAIEVVITGKKQIKQIKILPDVVDPEDIETLEDLILTAMNEAIRQAEDAATNHLGKITGGMNIPGGLF